MSFLFKRKKKEPKATATEVKLSDDTKRLYYTAEFRSLGDMTKDGALSIEEFYRLMMLLGYPKGKDGAKRLWKSKGKKSEGAKMTLDEYISLMFDAKVDSQTNMWRKLFAEFDTDGTGFASKQEVIQGLEKIGLPATTTMKAKIDGMDTNKDNKISYAEFLKEQLKQ